MKNFRKNLRWVTPLLVILMIFISGCQSETPAEPSSAEPASSQSEQDVYADDGRFKIVATTTQANDIAQILTAGVENVDIAPLMGAGVDPHLYQPTEADIEAMNTADMVIYSGLFLEGQFDTVFAALREQGVLIHALSDPVRSAGFTIGGFTLSDELVDVDDPHFWFDPRNWALTITDLGEALATIDSQNGELYRQNATEYAADMDAIFEWASAGMNSVAEGQRFIVTSHDAFQYFGGAFGWQMAAIQGLSTEDEAGVGDIQETVDFIIENQIPVVFVESSLPPDTIEAVIEAVAAAGGDVRIGVREMYSDAMGQPGSFGGTYIGMIGENVYTILQSYQCAGVDVTIPSWPADLEPVPDDALLNIDC